MKEHRIISAGNSSAVTLSFDELIHLGIDRGDVVTIQKAAKDRLIIRRKELDRPKQTGYN